MNIQSINQSGINFDGRVHTIGLGKKQTKIIHQLKPFLDKQIQNKNYDLYIAAWSKPWRSDVGLNVWAGKSAKYPNKEMILSNDYFTNETVTSLVKQAIHKYEAFFGPENVTKKKSFFERLFG